MTSYRIEALAGHDRSAFHSGSAPLDSYFRERAGQDVRRRVTSCFVAVDLPDETIAGFYTLAATSLVLDALPIERVKRLPRYPAVPAALLGRLAVAVGHRGRGLGGALVADALLRAGRSEVMSHAMVVEAKDEAAVGFFYEHLGFLRLQDDRFTLIRAL